MGDISDRLAYLAEQKIVHGGGCYQFRPVTDVFAFRSRFCRLFLLKASSLIQKYVYAPFTSERAQKIMSNDGTTYTFVKSQPMPH